jgi:flagellar biosynthetic protein FliQ
LKFCAAIPIAQAEEIMHSDLAMAMMADLFWTGLLVCLPVLGLVMLVGVVISVLQVVTQVQEMTLTFILVDGWAILLKALVGSFH